MDKIEESVHEFHWRIFEAIHGRSRERCIYGGVACVQNGYYNGQVSIMPAHPKKNIGKGSGEVIWVGEDEIEYPTN
jgi:hypothetical protein